MDTQKIDQFVQQYGKFFDPAQMDEIKAKLTNASDDKLNEVAALKLRDPQIFLWVFAVVLGGYGVDRFMLGDTVKAIIKLVTLGGCGVWSIIDWFSAKKRVFAYNYEKLMGILG